jgi:hypothetical protein
VERAQPEPALTDVIAGYGYATDPGAPDPVDILRSAVERIELIAPDLVPGIVDLLLEKAADGCHVRAIIEDPDAHGEPLLGVDGIEVRASAGGQAFGLHRADDQMLLVLRRIGVLTESPPVFLLQGRTSHGLPIGSPTSSRNAGTTRRRSPTASAFTHTSPS